MQACRFLAGLLLIKLCFKLSLWK